MLIASSLEGGGGDLRLVTLLSFVEHEECFPERPGAVLKRTLRRPGDDAGPLPFPRDLDVVAVRGVVRRAGGGPVACCYGSAVAAPGAAHVFCADRVPGGRRTNETCVVHPIARACAAYAADDARLACVWGAALGTSRALRLAFVHPRLARLYCAVFPDARFSRACERGLLGWTGLVDDPDHPSVYGAEVSREEELLDLPAPLLDEDAWPDLGAKGAANGQPGKSKKRR